MQKRITPFACFLIFCLLFSACGSFGQPAAPKSTPSGSISGAAPSPQPETRFMFICPQNSETGTVVTNKKHIDALVSAYQKMDSHYSHAANPNYNISIIVDGLVVNWWPYILSPAYTGGAFDALGKAFEDALAGGQTVWFYPFLGTRPAEYPKAAEALQREYGYTLYDPKGNLAFQYSFITLQYAYDNSSGEYDRECGNFGGDDVTLGVYPFDDIFLPMVEQIQNAGILYAQPLISTSSYTYGGKGAYPEFNREMTIYLSEKPEEAFLNQLQEQWEGELNQPPYKNQFIYTPVDEFEFVLLAPAPLTPGELATLNSRYGFSPAT